MNVFEKCSLFGDAEAARVQNLYPYFHEAQSVQGPEVIVEGKPMIMLGSNNYLGLSSHPVLIEKSVAAIRALGVGSVGSRFLTGNTNLHNQLEHELAKFLMKESLLLFPTGMQANLGVISSLVSENDVAVLDRLSHASIIDAMRISPGRALFFQHNDAASFETVLRKVPPAKGKIVIVEGVYSMEGDYSPLPEIVRIAAKYDARILVDDAHGIGVLGTNGRGTCELFGVENSVDLIVGTFSKAFSSIGGFVAGSASVVDYIRHHARSQIFSAAFPPSCAATVLGALEIIRSEPERRERLQAITGRMRVSFAGMGFDIGNSKSHIIPLVIGDASKVLHVWRFLFDRGIFVTPVVSPAVPAGRDMIRMSFMSTHTDEQLARVVELMEAAAKKFDILRTPLSNENASA